MLRFRFKSLSFSPPQPPRPGGQKPHEGVAMTKRSGYVVRFAAEKRAASVRLCTKVFFHLFIY